MASSLKLSVFLLFFFFLLFGLPGDGDGDGDADFSLLNPTLFLSHHSFLATYQDMEANLRVYIYPSQGNLTFSPSPPSPGEAEDDDAAFFRSLSRSDFSVRSEEDAHLFYMPLSMLRDPSASPARNALKYVQAIRQRFPFWQRTLGADHFLASCIGLNRSSSRDVLELQKNAVLLACSSLFTASPSSEFYPHKDLAMPPRVKCPKKILENLNPRPNLVTSLGEPDLISLPCSEIAPTLTSSRFCLTSTLNPSLLLVDALRSGCVPIIASAGYLRSLPFQDILDWHQFVVVVSERALPDLKPLLQNMPLERYQALQRNGIAAAKYLEWNDPPQPYDAFHLLLYEVWTRRHVIRYVRREGM